MLLTCLLMIIYSNNVLFRQIFGASHKRHGRRTVQKQIHEARDLRGTSVVCGQFDIGTSIFVRDIAGWFNSNCLV